MNNAELDNWFNELAPSGITDAVRQAAERDTMYGDATRANARENDAIKRAEAAEAALAAVPRQAIDALFRQQFGSYPIWFNETWTPIADWLGYKPARR